MRDSPARSRVGMLFVLLLLVASSATAQTGTIVVTNKAAHTASVIDVESGSMLATLRTGRGPHEVVLSSDGGVAVVADYGDRTANNTLTVIDVPALRVARTIDLGEYSRPHGIAFLPGDTVVGHSLVVLPRQRLAKLVQRTARLG